jgi:hypothetical protein
MLSIYLMQQPVYCIQRSLCRLIRRPEHLIGRHWYLPPNWRSFIRRSVSQSVLRHRLWQKLLLCSVLCLYDSCESMSNQPALWTPVITLYRDLVLTRTAQFPNISGPSVSPAYSHVMRACVQMSATECRKLKKKKSTIHVTSSSIMTILNFAKICQFADTDTHGAW